MNPLFCLFLFAPYYFVPFLYLRGLYTQMAKYSQLPGASIHISTQNLQTVILIYILHTNCMCVFHGRAPRLRIEYMLS